MKNSKYENQAPKKRGLTLFPAASAYKKMYLHTNNRQRIYISGVTFFIYAFPRHT